VCLFMSSWLIVFSLILLVPSFLVASVKEESSAERVEVVKKSNKMAAEEGIQEEAQMISDEVNILLDQNVFVLAEGGLIERMLGSKPVGIHIDSIFYKKDDGSSVLRGLSDDRDTLLEFIKILEGKKDFYNIDLPISNLVKDKDIEFTIKIDLHDESKN